MSYIYIYTYTLSYLHAFFGQWCPRTQKHHLIICVGSAKRTYHLFIQLNQLQMCVCLFFRSFFPSALAFLTFPLFFFPSLIQWGHLKSIGKRPTAPSLILSTGMGIPYCSHKGVFSSCPKAKAWQIKTSNSTNWWEKESCMCCTGSGELL